LNKLRIYGYRYSDGTYIGDGNCTFQLTTDVTNGMCTDWGNPLGEIFTESLRYLAGKTPSSDFHLYLVWLQGRRSGLAQTGLGGPVFCAAVRRKSLRWRPSLAPVSAVASARSTSTPAIFPLTKTCRHRFPP
jgi:hypothetical protein